MTVLPDFVTIVILAAGKGTRMKSDIAKVLHTISGRPMIKYVVAAATRAAGDNVIVVVGNQAEEVQRAVEEEAGVKFVFQQNQKGTGHAVKCALSALPPFCKEVLILSGDVPLIKVSTIQRLVQTHISNHNDVTLLTVKLENPYGYGRVVFNQFGNLERIVEEKDATDDEKQIDIINSGIYCVKRNFLEPALLQIKSNNVQNEMYLTDIVDIGCRSYKKVGFILSSDQAEILGVNTPQDLCRIESFVKGI